MLTTKQRPVLVIDKRSVIGPEFTGEVRDHGFSVIYRNSVEEAKKMIRQEKPALIVAEATSAGDLLSNQILSQRQDGIFLLDAQLNLLGYFEGIFFTKDLANFLSDYLKALSQ